MRHDQECDSTEFGYGGRMCAIADCPNQAAPKRRLCSMHNMRAFRGLAMDVPKGMVRANRLQGLIEAAIAVVDCDSEDDGAYEARVRELVDASDAHYRSRHRGAK